MIHLSFDDDRAYFDVPDEAAEEDPAVMCETLFWLPLHLRVGAIDVMAHVPPLSVLGFVLALRQAVVDVHEDFHAEVAIGCAGQLVLQMDDDRVVLLHNTEPTHTAVPWAVLRDEVERFSEEVGAFLTRVVPDITEHPQWPHWFPSGG